MGAMEAIVKQVRDLLGSMTVPARIMAALMAGVIVISFGWILNNQQNSQMEFLFGGQQFSDEELKIAEKALGEAGLRKYEREGSRIKIPTTERDLYLKALAEGDAVPKDWGSEVAKALSSNNPFEAQNLIDRRYGQARNLELARLIESKPGIERAYVTYDEKRTGFGRNATQTATVFVQGVGNKPLSMDVMRQIGETATTVYAGLKLENVTVHDINSTHNYRGSSDPNSVDQQPYLQAQRMWEEDYGQKIRGILASYGDVKIGVHVELDPTLKRESEKMKYDPVGIAKETTTSRKDSKSTKPNDGGRPGAEPNAAFANKSAAVSTPTAQTSEVKETSEDQKSVIGHEATVVKEAPLTPRSVKVSVGISETYFSQLWNQRFLQANPGKTVKDVTPITPTDLIKLKTETEKNVRDAVLAILPGVREGDDRYPLVTVVYNPDIPLPELPVPSLADNALAWLGKSWSTLGLFALVAMSLMMMFSFVRAQVPAEKEKQFTQGFGLDVPASMSDSLELGDEEKKAEEEGDGAPAFEITGGEMKEELSSLVKQNPDAAVNLLRTWIGDAA